MSLGGEAGNPSGRRIALLIAYTVLILLTSLIPMDRDIESLRFIIGLKPTVQNLLHIPMFAVLSILSLQVLAGFNVTNPRKFVIVAFAAIAFGLVNEALQLWVPGRYAGLLDMGLNTLGVLLGMLVYALVSKSNLNLLRRLTE